MKFFTIKKKLLLAKVPHSSLSRENARGALTSGRKKKDAADDRWRLLTRGKTRQRVHRGSAKYPHRLAERPIRDLVTAAEKAPPSAKLAIPSTARMSPGVKKNPFPESLSLLLSLSSFFSIRVDRAKALYTLDRRGRSPRGCRS